MMNVLLVRHAETEAVSILVLMTIHAAVMLNVQLLTIMQSVNALQE